MDFWEDKNFQHTRCDVDRKLSYKEKNHRNIPGSPYKWVVLPGSYGSASINGVKNGKKNSFAANRFKGEEINDALQKIFFIIKDRILGRFPSIGPMIYTSPIFGRLSDSVNSFIKYQSRAT